MFGNCQLGGVNQGSVDVCNTPSASGVTPVTYSNTSQGVAATNFSPKVMYSGGNAHNMGTSIATSNGDEAGVAGGLASGTFMNATRHTTGCYTLLVGGQPATKLTSVSIQNSTNSVGSCISPAQTKVLLLKS